MADPPARAPRDVPPGGRRAVLLRLDPAVHDALARWAADDLRSVNAQIDLLLRRALADAGRTPARLAPPARRGRPARVDDAGGPDGDAGAGAPDNPRM